MSGKLDKKESPLKITSDTSATSATIEKNTKGRIITAQLYTASSSDSFGLSGGGGSSSSSSSPYTSSSVRTLLQNHVDNGEELRNMSDYLYNTSGVYRRLIDTTKNLISYEYSIIPMIPSKEKINEKMYLSKLNKVKQYLWDCNFDATLDDIVFKLIKYGRYSGYDRDTYIQPLPINYTRIVGISVDGNPLLQFNFEYFDTFMDDRTRDFQFLGFDKFFKAQYQRFKNSIDNPKENFANELNWRMLPPEKTYTFKIGANMESAEGLGLLYGTVDEILYYDEVKSLDKAIITSQKRKILVQKLPIDKDGNSILGEDDIFQAHENLKSLTPSNVGVLTVLGGTEIEDVPLQLSALEKGKGNEIKDDILLSSGVGEGALKGGNFSAGVLNIEVLTNTIVKVLKQIENIWFNRKFNTLVGNGQYKFRMKFLGVTTFNKEDIIDSFDGLLDKGGNITLSINARGLSTEEYMDILAVEDYMTYKDLFKPLQTSYTMGTDSEGGRPTGTGSGGDNTDASNDTGGNELPSPSD